MPRRRMHTYIHIASPSANPSPHLSGPVHRADQGPFAPLVLCPPASTHNRVLAAGKRPISWHPDHVSTTSSISPTSIWPVRKALAAGAIDDMLKVHPCRPIETLRGRRCVPRSGRCLSGLVWSCQATWRLGRRLGSLIEEVVAAQANETSTGGAFSAHMPHLGQRLGYTRRAEESRC